MDQSLNLGLELPDSHPAQPSIVAEVQDRVTPVKEVTLVTSDIDGLVTTSDALDRSLESVGLGLGLLSSMRRHGAVSSEFAAECLDIAPNSGVRDPKTFTEFPTRTNYEHTERSMESFVASALNDVQIKLPDMARQLDAVNTSIQARGLPNLEQRLDTLQARIQGIASNGGFERLTKRVYEPESRPALLRLLSQNEALTELMSAGGVAAFNAQVSAIIDQQAYVFATLNDYRPSAVMARGNGDWDRYQELLPEATRSINEALDKLEAEPTLVQDALVDPEQAVPAFAHSGATIWGLDSKFFDRVRTLLALAQNTATREGGLEQILAGAEQDMRSAPLTEQAKHAEYLKLVLDAEAMLTSRAASAVALCNAVVEYLELWFEGF